MMTGSTFLVISGAGMLVAHCFLCFGACRWLDVHRSWGMKVVGSLVLMGWGIMAFGCSVMTLSTYVVNGLSEDSPLPAILAVIVGLFILISTFAGGGWLYLRCWNQSVGFWRGVRFIATYYTTLIFALWGVFLVHIYVIPVGQPLILLFHVLSGVPDWGLIISFWYFAMGAPLMWWLVEHLRRGLDFSKT